MDALVPIGRGQRELILGDRQTGKTTVAVEAILNQRAGDVVSVYCAIGQRASAVARVVADLERRGALARSIVVVAGGDDAPGLQFAAPYAATTMAEYFMERGQDTLVVYDDLTRHARAHRELSLLLRRPPGREAYPGDIFLCPRPAARAGHVSPAPARRRVADGAAGDRDAGPEHHRLHPDESHLHHGRPGVPLPGAVPEGHAAGGGRRPAGLARRGKAQLPAYRTVAGELRLSYAQYEELETFARFGTRLVSWRP